MHVIYGIVCKERTHTVMESAGPERCSGKTAVKLMAPDDAWARNQELFCASCFLHDLGSVYSVRGGVYWTTSGLLRLPG